MPAAVQERIFEATFESGKSYADPFNDVDVEVVFSAAEKSWRVPAFWQGGSRWTVRFAPPEPGRYAYRLHSTDRDNAALNGREGIVTITPYAGANPLLRRGAFRVSANRRYFEQADGTPFYWLGDTWYMGVSDRISWDGFKRLTADRKAKGFTAIAMSMMAVSNEETAPSDAGFCNEGGCVWDEQFRTLNPNYFDYADRRVQHLVEEGLAPVLIASWRQALPQMGVEKMKKYWRYLIARYGAYPVFWVAGGELFDPPEEFLDRFPNRQRFKDITVPGWTDVVRYIRATDPYHHPLSVHEFPPPVDTAIQDESLTDFDFFQPSHGGWASIAAQVAQLNLHYARTGMRKPLVVAETGWENIAKGHLEDFQRVAFWLAMLNGAAGFSYGNTEIAEAYTADKPLHRFRHSFHTWEEALQFPAAYQLALGARLLQTYAWWRFEPHPEWVTPRGATLLDPHDQVNGFDIDLTGVTRKERPPQHELPAGVWHAAGGVWNLPYAAGIPGEVRFIYLPYVGTLYNRSPLPTVLGLERGVYYHAFYWEPSLGVKVDLGAVALPEAGDVIVQDSFDARRKPVWIESGSLCVLKDVSEKNGVVTVEARSDADAVVILRYRDQGNYLAGIYSAKDRSIYLIDRKDAVDGRPLGRTPVPEIGETFTLTVEARNTMAAASMTDGRRSYATPIVEVAKSEAGSAGLLHTADGAQRFARFELRASPKLVEDAHLEKKLYDAEGRYRGEWVGPVASGVPGGAPPTSMDDYGKDKHILLGAYRPERLPFIGDWVLVLAV